MKFLILAAQNLERQYYERTRYMFGTDSYMYEFTPIKGLKDTAYEVFEKYEVPVPYRLVIFTITKELFGSRKRATELFSKMHFTLYNIDNNFFGKSGRITNSLKGDVYDYLTINGLGISSADKKEIELFIYSLKLNGIYDKYIKAISEITSSECDLEKLSDIKSKTLLKLKKEDFYNYFETLNISTIYRNYDGGNCPKELEYNIFPCEEIKENNKIRKREVV